MHETEEEQRRVVLGVTGSIAAYKAAELARILVTRNYPVKCIVTESAQQFITPLTMQAVTGAPVMTSMWQNSAGGVGIEHIELADWAEAFVVAPATADAIAKMAAGFAGSPLLAALLATKAPVLVAPAMNVNMFTHPKTVENLEALRARGVTVVDPEEGALACGWNGTGRLADPMRIFQYVRRLLSRQDLAGKRILVATGPTREAIDPVRFISNRSSGKMGVALAREAFRRGADVTVVHGPVQTAVPDVVKSVPVGSAAEMRDAILRLAFDGEPYDVVIMAAAVADFRPESPKGRKIKKGEGLGAIPIVHNPDILAELGARKAERPAMKLVGFAVETGELPDLLEELRRKLSSKNADLMVGNFAADAFDLDTNRVWLVSRHGRQDEVATTLKERVANKILDAVQRI